MVARVGITCLDGVTLQVVALYFLRTKCCNDFALNSCIIMSWGYLWEKPAKWSTSFLQSVKSCSHPIFSICLGLCILALTPYKFQPWTRDLRFVYFRTFCQPRFAAVKHLDKLKRLINFAAIFQKKKQTERSSFPTKKRLSASNDWNYREASVRFQSVACCHSTLKYRLFFSSA